MKTKKSIVSVLVVCFLFVLLCVPTSAEWRTTRRGTRYYTGSGKTDYVKEKWYKINGKWFYFNAKGYRLTGQFTVNGKTFYVDENDGAAKDKIVKGCYYNSKGVMQKKKWITTSKGYEYYCSRTGKIRYGQFTLNGNTYYCKKKDGKVWARWKNGSYYDKDGVMVKNAWVGDSYVNGEGKITKGVKNPVNASNCDVRLLAALVWYEAGNQSYYGKQCVASVVLNRMKNKTFPDTLRGVIFQSGQFTPAMNGCVDWLYYSGSKIDRDCIYAARTVLTEGTKLKGYYFFNNFAGEKKIGDHYFSKKYH